MNLTNYLPSALIDHAVAYNRSPRTFNFSHLDDGARLTLRSVAMMLLGGAKVIRPSTELCEVLKDVELNIGADDYAQPFDGLGVVLPGSLCGTDGDRLATTAWKPGNPIVVTFHGKPQRSSEGQTVASHLNLTPPRGVTIEEYIAGVGLVEGWDSDEVERLRRLVSLARIVVNLCLFAVERGVRIQPHDARAEKQRRRSSRDARMARLSAREAQEVVIQDLDLFLRGTPPERDRASGAGSWRQRMHRRRGHWKMQAHGPGRSLRRRIFVRSYMVHIKDVPDGEVVTVLS